MNPKVLALRAAGLAAVHEYACDAKVSAFRFTASNHHSGCHHFCDARETFMRKPVDGIFKGTCALHGFGSCKLPRLNQGPGCGVKLSGIVCWPYTTCRTGRRSGTTEHAESDLQEAFLAGVEYGKPHLAIFEQVFGFAMAESREDSVSPLCKFLEACAERLPQYRIAVYVLNGSQYGVFHRRRLYLALVLDTIAEGGRTLDRMTALIKDRK